MIAVDFCCYINLLWLIDCLIDAYVSNSKILLTFWTCTFSTGYDRKPSLSCRWRMLRSPWCRGNSTSGSSCQAHNREPIVPRKRRLNAILWKVSSTVLRHSPTRAIVEITSHGVVDGDICRRISAARSVATSEISAKTAQHTVRPETAAPLLFFGTHVNRPTRRRPVKRGTD